MVMRYGVLLSLSAWWWAGANARSLDPGACAARFDVQRDKIIRTEESREMGARYLAELDVGGRPECLRLCCETDSCDVFVFEEKSPGSCYLFACGPPEDFRCKFTAHGNFSSGVLAISRHLAELQDQERLAPLRHQLADLSRGRSTSTSSTPPPAPRPPPQPTPSHTPSRKAAGTTHCSRYQFACATGGECVAVYNACDGVPQCADGSDEAPELACPPAPTAAPPRPATTIAPLPTQVRLESEIDTGGELSAADAVAVAEAAELWPHRLTQAQPQHHYNDAVPGPATGEAARGPHIFSHTGGLVQQLGEPPVPALNWARHAWPQAHRVEPEWSPQQPAAPPGYWPDAERIWSPHRIPPAPQRVMEQRDSVIDNTMPELPLVYGGERNAVLRDAPKKGFELMAAAERVPYTPSPSLPPGAMVPNAAPLPNAPTPQQSIPIKHSPTPLENTTKKKVLKDIQPEFDNTIAAPSREEQLAVPPNEHGRSKQVEHRAPLEQHEHIGRVEQIGQHEHWASDEHEGLSEHPPAALLLLVLGTLLTAALGALAGCRLRAASRRRRHHKRYALDADYLVNGMYL